MVEEKFPKVDGKSGGPISSHVTCEDFLSLGEELLFLFHSPLLYYSMDWPPLF
jgi:hypothetical protein